MRFPASFPMTMELFVLFAISGHFRKTGHIGHSGQSMVFPVVEVSVVQKQCPEAIIKGPRVAGVKVVKWKNKRGHFGPRQAVSVKQHYRVPLDVMVD